MTFFVIIIFDNKRLKGKIDMKIKLVIKIKLNSFQID